MYYTVQCRRHTRASVYHRVTFPLAVLTLPPCRIVRRINREQLGTLIPLAHQARCGPITRNVEAFLEKTAIAYRQNMAFFLEFGWHAIAVFSKNATTLRVVLLPPAKNWNITIEPHVGTSELPLLERSAIFSFLFVSAEG